MIICYSLNLVLCLHLAINSHLLLNNFRGSGCVIISTFSSRHILNLPSKHFGVFDFFNIDHWILGVNPLFFKLQNCLDRAVWCFRCSWVKEYLWQLFRVLQLRSFCLLLFFTPLEFFTSVLADGFSLEFEWQQVSSSLQDSSHYSGRPQQCCHLDNLYQSANFQVLQAL